MKLKRIFGSRAPQYPPGMLGFKTPEHDPGFSGYSATPDHLQISRHKTLQSSEISGLIQPLGMLGFRTPQHPKMSGSIGTNNHWDIEMVPGFRTPQHISTGGGRSLSEHLEFMKTPQHSSSSNPMRQEDVVRGFRTTSQDPSLSSDTNNTEEWWVCSGTKQRKFGEFRTPQHPSMGTNNWGGASPLLARNIPKESLDQRYVRLNTIRTRDEIFTVIDNDLFEFSQAEASKYECPPTPSLRRGLLWKLIRGWLEKSEVLGGKDMANTKKKRRRWLPKMDPTNRWPNGWC